MSLMAYVTIFLMLLAIAALATEILLPGIEIFGVAGVILLLASAVLAVLFMPFGWFVVGGQVVILWLFLNYFIRKIREKQLQVKIILRDTLAEDTPVNLTEFIGKTGKTVTSLRPYGEAEFVGTRLEVSSGGPLIPQGKQVRAIAIRESKLVVKEDILN